MTEPNSATKTRKRLLIVVLSIIFLFCVLFIRLGYIQLIKGKEFQAKATSQWYRDLPLSAQRGKILDANGEILADNKDVYTIYVRPNAVSDFSYAAKELASYLKLDESALYEKISTSRVSEITIKRKVEPSSVEELKSKNIPGVYFAVESKRNYPGGDSLSQILGFTNIDNEGQNGIEGYYDAYLKGVDGFSYLNTDLAGRETDDSVTKYVPSIPGCDVTMSIDANIQGFAEYAVKTAMVQWESKSASMIVMDVNDGGILAIASTPGFDLNDPPRDNIDLLNQLSKTQMIVDVFEPGSTFKIFTTAAAIDKGLTKESDRYFCSGYRLVDGQRIKCWRTIGHGSQDLLHGFQNSCNCVFMDLAARLGTNSFYSALYNFGFNSKTNIDFYGESRGIMMAEESVKNVDLARIGFGQAVAVTPLQLITAMSSVVNGGTLYEPYFVKNITSFDGQNVYSREKKAVRQVIKSETSAQMRMLLESVVSQGSGKKAQVNGYSVGGKTGTAQKYENGTIARGKYVSSFLGFAPADNPKYAVLMIVDEPGTYAYYGSIVAAPSVSDVLSKIFNYKGETPTLKTETPQYVVMPNLIGKSITETVQLLDGLGLKYEMAGDAGEIISTLPNAGEKVEVGDIVLVRFSGSE